MYPPNKNAMITVRQNKGTIKSILYTIWNKVFQFFHDTNLSRQCFGDAVNVIFQCELSSIKTPKKFGM